MGLFITFEGGDGSGKTTQARALYGRLRRKNYSVILTQEPGGTHLGRMLRRWLTDPQSGVAVLPAEPSQLHLVEPPIGDQLLPDMVLHSTAPRAELLLFLIARAQLVDEVIRPNLLQEKTVICDRYAPSTVAYQGYGRQLNLDLINEANEIATQGIKPDLIVLLDIAPEEGLSRKWAAAGRMYFDDEELAFHRRVRDGYLRLAQAEPGRWLVVDGSQPKKKIEQMIWDKVAPLLESRELRREK
ncbi:MAG TPA: dTMP kinase [Dehalococcoidia bacterium]|nr:dTMP kinase [Dehalococcoidia bacterium]